MAIVLREQKGCFFYNSLTINLVDFHVWTIFSRLIRLSFGIAFLCATNFFQSFKSFAMSDIAERVKKIIIDKLGVDESEVNPEASFTNDLGADSLDTVELIMEFEKEFNISIPDEQAENITNVGEAISYLEEHVK